MKPKSPTLAVKWPSRRTLDLCNKTNKQPAGHVKARPYQIHNKNSGDISFAAYAFKSPCIIGGTAP